MHVAWKAVDAAPKCAGSLLLPLLPLLQRHDLELNLLLARIVCMCTERLLLAAGLTFFLVLAWLASTSAWCACRLAAASRCTLRAHSRP